MKYLEPVKPTMRLGTFLLALLLSSFALVAVGQTPASAATTCSYGEDDLGTPRRMCTINTSITGARLEGFAYWYYENPDTDAPNAKSGSMAATLYDTVKDGVSAWVKLTYRSRKYPSYNNTRWIEARGEGNRAPVTPTFNKAPGHYRSGTYAAYVCVDKKNCVMVFRQNINAPNP